MYQKTYKTYCFAVLGGQRVGKTNIVNRFMKDQFKEADGYTLQKIQSKFLDLDGKVFQVRLHDTASNSSEKLMSTIKNYWRNDKDGFIVTFALNCDKSFSKAIQQIQEIKSLNHLKNATIILLGNKKDLEDERRVSKNIAMEEAERLGIKYFEVSAKKSSKQQIDKLISQLIETNQMSIFWRDTEHTDSQTAFSPVLNWNPCEDIACQIM